MSTRTLTGGPELIPLDEALAPVREAGYQAGLDGNTWISAPAHYSRIEVAAFFTGHCRGSIDRSAAKRATEAQVKRQRSPFTA